MTWTHIEIDDALMEEVMDRHGFSTKSEAVDAALRGLAPSFMSRDEALAMRGTGWDGNLDALRDGLSVDER
ncbi:MAG: type II toxin-antitoxin system VapB family antitoxin [Actinomycetia bacterium]|nr:type II toxin-antitoxin system VapB family antitoxin [Actinomycetes bacterium]